MYRFFVTLILLVNTIACCNFAYAEIAEQYYFRKIDVADGLLSSSINTTFQHSNGFVWIGTDRGLSRYDGESFIHYRYSPGESNHISNNFIIQIAEDVAQNLWVVTEDGINKISPDGLVTIYNLGLANSKGLETSWFTSLLVDSKNRIWIGANNGFYLYSPEPEQFIKFKSVHNDTRNIARIVEMPNGDIYLAEFDGLSKVNFADKSYDHVKGADGNKLLDDYTYKLIVADAENIWIGTEKQGAVKINVATNTIVESLNTSTKPEFGSDMVDAIFKDNDGLLWFGHWYNALSIYDPKSKEVKHLKANEFEPNNLPSNAVYHVMQDKAGLIWLATGDGIAIFNPAVSHVKRVHKKVDNLGLSNNWVYDIDVDGKGQVWISTESGLNTLDLATGRIIQQPMFNPEGQPVEPFEIWNLAPKSPLEFYLATKTGLQIYNIQTHVVTQLVGPDNRLSREMYTADMQGDKGVWVTGYGDVGLHLVNDNGEIEQQYFNEKTSEYWVGGNFTYSLVISERGDIVMATTHNVFAVNPKTNETAHIIVSANKAGIRISDIVEHKANEFWLTSPVEGLIKMTLTDGFNNPQVQHFNQQTGYPFSELNSIASDGDFLWLAGRQSLIKFDTRDHSYQIFDNLSPLESFVFADSAILKHENYLLLGSNKGLFIVDTNQLLPHEFEPLVQLSSVVNGEESIVFTNDKVEDHFFGHDRNDLEFRFSALDFTDPRLNKYRYRLLGQSDEWSEPSTANRVRLSSLDPGDYVFEVQGTNSAGRWATDSAKFYFTITYAWWFYALIASALILFFAAIIYNVKRKQFFEALNKHAHEDSLTGLQNRYSYNQVISKHIEQRGKAFSVLLVDLDGFKDINDGYGHLVGDKFLAEIATNLSSCLRKNDIAARLGGDEFAIVLDTINEKKVTHVASCIGEKARQPITVDGHILSVSASIGVVMYPMHAEDAASLFGCADAAMYAAKRSGKNAIYFYDQKLGDEISNAIALRRYLKNALSNNEFELYYQPKVNQHSGQIVGVEALLRWYHPEQGFISPGVFIPEAERNGTIVQIGDWVITQACVEAKKWQNAGIKDFRIAINLSPLQLARHDFLDVIDNILIETGASPTTLEFEITESMLIESPKQCQRILSALQAKGAKIALDDFGAGYSSLSYLAQYNIDVLKIDRSLFIDIEANIRNQNILKNIYSLAHDLELDVVAEGIEEQAQLDILKKFKGDIIQGFVFYRPMPCDQVFALLNEQLVGTN